MTRVPGPVAQQLRCEIADVEPEHGGLSHRDVPPRGCLEKTVAVEAHLAHLEEPAAQVRVLAVELNRRVESPNAIERVSAHCEVAAVEMVPRRSTCFTSSCVAGASVMSYARISVRPHQSQS